MFQSMQTTKKNDEVFFAKDKIVTLNSSYIASLKRKAVNNPNNRVRLCAHKRDKDLLHEMFIVHTKNTYVRPHKHLGKEESLSIIEGRGTFFLFNEKGQIVRKIKIGNYQSGLVCYIRIELPIYHNLVINSRYLVFHEVIRGPFDSSHAIAAPWSPPQNEKEKVKVYLKQLGKASSALYYAQ